MSQSRSRKYRCQVTLTVDDASTAYMVRAVDGGWRFEKADGSGYSLAVCLDRATHVRRIACTCQGNRSHGHCKHADWLRLMGVGPSAEANLDLAAARTELAGMKILHEKQRGEVAQLWEELNKKHEQLLEEGYLLDQANRTVARLEETISAIQAEGRTQAEQRATEIAEARARSAAANPYTRTADRPEEATVIETKSKPKARRRKAVA
jgi:hypothetical protein